MAEKYIEKSIDTPCGVPALVWDGVMFACNLDSGKGHVDFAGYIDEAAFVGSKLALDFIQETIEDITQLTTYETFFGEALTKFVTQMIPGEEEGDPDTEGLFYGGSVEPCPIDQHGRNLIKPIVVETGATAECWRCVSLQADLKAGKARFVMRGWKDVDAFCNGKKKASFNDVGWTVTFPIEEFATYPDLYNEIVGRILADADSKLYGAELKQTS